jgi:class 3 adenylate cyclase
MHVGPDESCPLPEDPVLAEVATVMRDSGEWAWVVDREWRLVYVTDEQRLSLSAGTGMVSLVLGERWSSTMPGLPAELAAGPELQEMMTEMFRRVGGLVVDDVSGGKAEVRRTVEPPLREMVDGLAPSRVVAMSAWPFSTGTGGEYVAWLRAIRLRDETGQVRGTALVFKPAAGMHVLGALALERDLAHLERMRSVRKAGRRPAALLFADLEGSSALARTLPTANYFALGRRIVRATDRCVVDAGGLVGRHVGDGVVAFFPAEIFDSESAAARACITAARDVRAAMAGVAERSDVAADQLVMRFGLHWGSTVFIGNISTAARAEVTALGDEVNEAARIEACATGGRTLASKPLVERLAAEDAGALGIDADRVTYTQLADLDTATDKARRDAPAVAVCDLA